MPKTEVILTHNIIGLGAESDQVKVAAGYARNYLFPQRLAIPLTSANKRQIEVLRQRRAEREAHEFNSMSELARGISKLTAVIKVKTGDDGCHIGQFDIVNATFAPGFLGRKGDGQQFVGIGTHHLAGPRLARLQFSQQRLPTRRLLIQRHLHHCRCHARLPNARRLRAV
jgi:ribosomal protein L9